MTKPVRMGLGASLGSGQQWVPWIHIEDLTRLFYWAEKHGKTGIFNAVAPERITNRQLTQAIARVLKKPLRLPNVPAFVLKAALGKLSVLALEGNAVSSQLLQQEGFHFRYPKIDEALRNLIDK